MGQETRPAENQRLTESVSELTHDFNAGSREQGEWHGSQSAYLNPFRPLSVGPDDFDLAMDFRLVIGSNNEFCRIGRDCARVSQNHKI